MGEAAPRRLIEVSAARAPPLLLFFSGEGAAAPKPFGLDSAINSFVYVTYGYILLQAFQSKPSN
jgi:hypothetical protein